MGLKCKMRSKKKEKKRSHPGRRTSRSHPSNSNPQLLRPRQFLHSKNFFFLSLAPWVQQSHEHVTPSVRWSFTQPNLSTGDMKKKKRVFPTPPCPGRIAGERTVWKSLVGTLVKGKFAHTVCFIINNTTARAGRRWVFLHLADRTCWDSRSRFPDAHVGVTITSSLLP